MRRCLALATTVVGGLVFAGCGTSSTPAAPVPGQGTSAHRDLAQAWAQVFKTAGHVRGTASVQGFRVHPDPDADGIIHVVQGDGVVINAVDLAAAPPAATTYLIVNWGD